MSSSENNQVPMINQAPIGIYVTQERFAEMTGVSLEVVRGWVKKGFLPTFVIGKYRLVNTELMKKTAMEQDFKV
jgi:predicted site-specific integrase-resolvase